jgi:hypothetical protein
MKILFCGGDVFVRFPGSNKGKMDRRPAEMKLQRGMDPAWTRPQLTLLKNGTRSS